MENDDTDTPMPTITFLSYNAAFTLSLECKDNMTVEGLNDAVSSCKTLVEPHIRIYQNHVRKKFESRGLAFDYLDSIDIDSLLLVPKISGMLTMKSIIDISNLKS